MAPPERRLLRQVIALIAGSVLSLAAQSQPSAEVICAYAPSQNEIVKEIRAAAAGARYGQILVLAAGSLKIVQHSSGGLIVSGPGGFVRGTMPVARAAVITTKVGLVIGAAALTVELACAPTNHPELVETVVSNSQEYWGVTVRKYRKLTGYRGSIVSASESNASEHWRNRVGDTLLPAAMESLDRATKYWSNRLGKIDASSVATGSAESILGVRTYWSDKWADW